MADSTLAAKGDSPKSVKEDRDDSAKRVVVFLEACATVKTGNDWCQKKSREIKNHKTGEEYSGTVACSYRKTNDEGIIAGFR